MRHCIGIASVIAALLSSGCATSTGSSPTEPTSSVRQLSFAQDEPAPSGESVAITRASRDQAEGTITLAVAGFNLVNRGIGVLGAEGRVMWDGSLLEVEAVDSGDFLRQDGVVPDRCTPGTANVLDGSTNGFCWQRDPSVQPFPHGTGELHLFRLRPRSGVTSGTSAIRFVQVRDGFPALVVLSPFGSQFQTPRETQLEHYYGGTITIR